MMSRWPNLLITLPDSLAKMNTTLAVTFALRESGPPLAPSMAHQKLIFCSSIFQQPLACNIYRRAAAWPRIMTESDAKVIASRLVQRVCALMGGVARHLVTAVIINPRDGPHSVITRRSHKAEFGSSSLSLLLRP
jgi:hypothetical protein